MVPGVTNNRGDIVGAEQLYRRAVSLDPNEIDGLLGLGMALQSRNMHDEAIDSYEAAAKLDMSAENGLIDRFLFQSCLSPPSISFNLPDILAY